MFYLSFPLSINKVQFNEPIQANDYFFRMFFCILMKEGFTYPEKIKLVSFRDLAVCFGVVGLYTKCALDIK